MQRRGDRVTRRRPPTAARGRNGERHGPTVLKQARELLGLRSRPCAHVMGIDPSAWQRIEAGQYRPNQDTASRIYDFFGGTLELGVIAFPTHPLYARYLTEHRVRLLRHRGRELAERYPRLRTDRARLET